MLKRMLAYFLTLITLFSALSCRMAALSTGGDAAQSAGYFGGRTVSVEINSARGVIRDRCGVILAGGTEREAVLVEPLSLSEASLIYLRAHAVQPTDEVLERLISAGRPFLVYTDKPLYAQGMTRITALSRYGSLARHLIGYLDADGHGADGVERACDGYLASDESAYTAVYRADAVRHALSGFGIAFEGSPCAVKSGVTLTLDAGIQGICEEAADEFIKRGSVVVCDIESGGLAACVSRPDYDPENIAASLSDGDALLNKALCRFCCGSAFKIIVAAAALENGIGTGEKYECTGEFEAGENIIACSKHDGHGEETMREAFAASCNTYFCALAQRVGGDKILEMARRFGLGESVVLCDGIESASGRLPDLQNLSVSAATANFAIGQGELQVTPLQVLQLSSVIASGGVYRPLYLIDGYTDKEGSFIGTEPQSERRVISREIADAIKEMMVYATKTPAGTGTPAAPQVLSAGVKTSSAETGIYENGNQILHTWAVGFYPAEKPRYAICVLVEGGRSGYYSAAPVFAEIADGLFKAGFVSIDGM